MEIEVPEYLEHDEGLVIFNIESGRNDDLMSINDQLISLRFLLTECASKGLGMVVLAPKKVATQVSGRFTEEVGKRIWIHETDSPHELKIVNKRNPGQVYVWVSTCS